MKTDLYTKTILTVIAVALITLVFQNFDVVPTATASPSPNLSNMNANASTGTIDVNIVSINGYSLFGKTLEVEVTNTPEVKIDSDYGGLDVNVTNYRDFE